MDTGVEFTEHPHPTPAVEAAHDDAVVVEPGGHAHPGPAEYVKIAVILAVVTAVEVAVYYIEAIRPILVPILLIMSAIKFSLVVLWFMHLRFDNRLFSYMFFAALALTGAAILALLALFTYSTAIIHG